MIMAMKKQLLFLVHMLLLGVGFALACGGFYMLFLQTGHGPGWRVTAYFVIVFGIGTLLTGVFWTIFHSMKSKLYHGAGPEERIQVYTVERPSSFPPTYEESQSSRATPDAEFVVVADEVDVVLNLAPPLYSPNGSEAPDCAWSWEPPPRYSQVERLQ